MFFLFFASLQINVFRNKYFITKEFPAYLLKILLHCFAQNTVLSFQVPARYEQRKQGEENTKAKRDGNKNLPATPVPPFLRGHWIFIQSTPRRNNIGYTANCHHCTCATLASIYLLARNMTFFTRLSKCMSEQRKAGKLHIFSEIIAT